jgi:hypothetical protein
MQHQVGRLKMLTFRSNSSMPESFAKIDHNWKENAIGEFEIDPTDVNAADGVVRTELDRVKFKPCETRSNEKGITTLQKRGVPRTTRTKLQIIVGPCCINVTYTFRYPPRRERSRPVCLFINYLGSRHPAQRSAYHRVPNKRKDPEEALPNAQGCTQSPSKRQKSQPVAAFRYFTFKCGPQASKAVFDGQKRML